MGIHPNCSTPNDPSLAPSEDSDGEREGENAGNNEASTTGEKREYFLNARLLAPAAGLFDSETAKEIESDCQDGKSAYIGRHEGARKQSYFRVWKVKDSRLGFELKEGLPAADEVEAAEDENDEESCRPRAFLPKVGKFAALVKHQVCFLDPVCLQFGFAHTVVFFVARNRW